MPEEIETIVRDALQAQLPKTTVERVVVVPDVDNDGDKVLRVVIVFAGETREIDPDGMLKFIRSLRSRLVDADYDEYPSVSFVASNEADKIPLEAV